MPTLISTQILSGNVELRASERMTDAADGGGEMSSTIIVDNQINQIFGPISGSDRVAGRVNLREAYLHLNTANADTYYGANIIIDSPPTDPNVTALLFTLEQSGAQRTDAVNYLQSYVASGPRSQMQPIGTQNIGQQQVSAYQASTAALPVVGDVYILSIEATGVTQAIKIQAVIAYLANFSGYACTGLTLAITEPLQYTFPGSDPTSAMPGATWIRTSLPNTGAVYAGITSLAAAANSGDTSLLLTDIQAQLLPVSVSETSVTNTALNVVSSTLSAGTINVVATNTAHTQSSPVLQATNGLNWNVTLVPKPATGTLTASYRSNGVWYTLTDNGLGVLAGSSSQYGAGSINYTSGVASITCGALPDINSSIIWQWGSDAHYQQLLTATMSLPTIMLSTGESIDPGTLTIQYLKSGVTYTATTDNLGNIITSNNDLSGFVTNPTGVLHITCHVMPDALSNLVLNYVHTNTLSGTFSSTVGTGASSVTFTLSGPVKPGSVVMRWSATVANTSIQITYSQSVATSEYGVMANTTSSASPTAIVQGGLVDYVVVDTPTDSLTGTIGTFGTIDYSVGTCVLTLASAVTVPVYVNSSTYSDTGYSGGGRGNHITTTTSDSGQWMNTSCVTSNPSSVVVTYVQNTGTPNTRTLTAVLPAINILVGTNLTTDSIVPGSLRFTWNNWEFRDYGDGTIYSNPSPWTTQAGTLSGTINYYTRTVSLTYYNTGTGSVAILDCLTQYGNWPVSYAFGRTPGAPLTPGSFSIQCTAIDGTVLTGQADANGNVTGSQIIGYIDQEMGIYSLIFGVNTLASTLTTAQKAATWYKASNVNNGYIIVPTQVIGNTLKMNCVVRTALPLSAAQLGIDPVRLPATGKVPIFQPGTRAVIHNTQSQVLSNPVTAGATVDCGRTRIARVWLEDANGLRVPDSCFYPGQYVAFSSLTSGQQSAYSWWEIRGDGSVWLPSAMDLDAGIVQLASPLTLTGFTQPLTLYNTVEDAAMVITADLSGFVTINTALSRAYATSGTNVSSQLYIGDIWARYTNLFTQATWTNVWQSTPIGSATGGQYNDAAYPILVTNDGIIDEQWRITFTDTTHFNVYGARVGLIATGNTSTDCAPINPSSTNSSPYFVINYRGWGTGWVAGNVLRFDTIWPGDFWIARCIAPGVATGTADTIGIAFRGDSAPA